MNEPIGPLRVLQPGARAADGVGHGDDRLVLADEPRVQALLHVQQLLGLALHQAADRDAGPAADDLGDVVGVDLLLEQDRSGPSARELPPLGELLLELRSRAVLQLAALA